MQIFPPCENFHLIPTYTYLVLLIPQLTFEVSVYHAQDTLPVLLPCSPNSQIQNKVSVHHAKNIPLASIETQQLPTQFIMPKYTLNFISCKNFILYPGYIYKASVFSLKYTPMALRGPIDYQLSLLWQKYNTPKMIQGGH